VAVVTQRIIAAVITATIPVILCAQTSTSSSTLRDRDPDLAGAKKLASELQDANFHFGSVYLLSRLRVADAGYTETAYVPTGEDSGGLRLTVEAPQRLYFVPHKKTVFTAELVPGYNISSDDVSAHHRFDYLLRGDAHFLLNHLYLDLYTSRADQLRAQVEVNQLAPIEDDETGLAGEFKYSSRTSLQFAGRYREQRFPDDRFEPGDTPLALLDRSERNARLSFVHKTFPLTSLFVAAEGSNYGFRYATYKDSTRRYAGAGFLHDSGRTQLRVEAGPAILDFEDPSQHDFKGAIGNARLTRSNGRWTYNGTLSRDVAFSIIQDNAYYLVDSGTAGVSYAATRRLDLRANLVGQRLDYDRPVAGRLRRDTLSFSSLGFGYNLRKFGFGVDAGWYERDSTGGGDTDSGIRYVLHLSFTP
jgi:hypothetical protein